MNNNNKIQYADDDYESIGLLFKLRAPALIIGLGLGFLLSFVASRFEDLLARNVQVAFFIPFVVYIAAAIGSQTQAIYSRDLRSGKAKFTNYLRKESLLGLIFGLLFGAIVWLIIYFWLGNQLLAVSVAIASFLAITTAPVLSLIITNCSQLLKEDPAAEAGPIVTVIQDMISILIYCFVSSLIIL